MVQNNELRKSSAIKQRKNGKSYTKISQELGIPKSTLSNWLSQERWSKNVTRKILKTSYDSRISNLREESTKRRTRAEARHEMYRHQARFCFASLAENDLFLVGLSLYWGEGEKTKSGRVSIVNTDPNMIQTMVRFYVDCLKLNTKDLRIGIFAYEDHDIDMVLKFWSEITKIPLSQFIKTQVLKSRTKKSKRRSKYGICSLYCSNTELSIKIQEWIKLLGAHFTSKNPVSGISLPVK